MWGRGRSEEPRLGKCGEGRPFLRKGFDLLLSQLHGVLRVILEPLMGDLPIVGAVSMFFIRRPVRRDVEEGQGREDWDGEGGQLWGMEEGTDKKTDFGQLLGGSDCASTCSFLPDPRYQLDRDDQPVGYPGTQVSRTDWAPAKCGRLPGGFGAVKDAAVPSRSLEPLGRQDRCP